MQIAPIIYVFLCLIMLALIIWGIVYSRKDLADKDEINRSGYGLLAVGIFGCLLLSCLLGVTSCL